MRGARPQELPEYQAEGAFVIKSLFNEAIHTRRYAAVAVLCQKNSLFSGQGWGSLLPHQARESTMVTTKPLYRTH